MLRWVRANVCVFDAFGAVALLLLATLAGCGGSSNLELNDAVRIGIVVSNVSEAVTSPAAERFERLFAEGVAPPVAERAKYGPPLQFNVEGEPEVSGDSATFSVKVVRDEPNAAEPVAVGQVEWTAVKVGDQWKLKTAPLP